ncbi:MAG TPA: HAMP domain-containing sensor histidine kinase [Burkholderiaceae bacterium]|nr:HAMP domain-containing sensor histidine kinase [Burkholderiaceae bacterium]
MDTTKQVETHTDAAKNLSDSLHLTREQWFEFESNRLLLEPRKQTVSTFLRVCMGLALIFYAPQAAVVIWLLLSFAGNFWMQSLIGQYAKLLSGLSEQNRVMTAAMTHIAVQYKSAWRVNALIWGGASFLFIHYLPFNAQLITLVIANALAFLSITRTSVNVKLMNQVTAILILAQLLFAVLHFVSYQPEDSKWPIYAIYIVYLLFSWYLLRIVGRRFSNLHRSYWASEFSKFELINDLKISQQALQTKHLALLEADKVIQRFYSGAAHDLRQPISALRLYVDMLETDSEENKNLISKIKQSSDSVNQMFNELFAFHKLNLEDTAIAETVSITEIFNRLALHFEPIASTKQLQLKFRPITGSVKVVPGYFARILSNLITNAIRYTNQGGVLVCVRKTSDFVSFEVWDTGVGIQKTVQEKIFQEFFRIDAPNTDTEGLGLGLAIVSELVQRMDGARITLQSKSGKGSVFKLLIPITAYSLGDQATRSTTT